MAETPPINLAQALALLVIGYLALRGIYSFFRPSLDASPPPGLSRGGLSNNGSRVNPTHVDQVAQMFPQLNRRDIMWDLQRNGGSVQATTERVLSGRSLETPPPSFQPVMPQNSPLTITARVHPKPKTPSHPDLITRYNLSSKVGSGNAGAASSSVEASAREAAAKRQGWSNSKTERQALLQKRREEMILAARRKLEDSDRSI